MLSEVSQSEKANTVWFHSYVESNKQTELKSKIETDSDREQADSSAGGGDVLEGEGSSETKKYSLTTVWWFQGGGVNKGGKW